MPSPAATRDNWERTGGSGERILSLEECGFPPVIITPLAYRIIFKNYYLDKIERKFHILSL